MLSAEMEESVGVGEVVSVIPVPSPRSQRPDTDGQIVYVTPEQITALLAKCRVSVRDTAIFTVGYWRGLRASEVGKLRVEDWTPATNRLYVRRAKGSNSGEYVVSKAEQAALKAWVKVRGTKPGPMFPSRKRNPVSRQQLDTLVKHYAALAGWPAPKAMFKTLRHSIATHLLERGVEIYAVKDWLGHKSIMSTEVYAKVTNPTRQRAQELAYAGEGGGSDRPAVEWAKDKRGR